jgi:hypothetical protein
MPIFESQPATLVSTASDVSLRELLTQRAHQEGIQRLPEARAFELVALEVSIDEAEQLGLQALKD